MSNENQSAQPKRKKPTHPHAGRGLSDDGTMFMWRDSLFSNSRGQNGEAYDPMEARRIAGGVITPYESSVLREVREKSEVAA